MSSIPRSRLTRCHALSDVPASGGAFLSHFAGDSYNPDQDKNKSHNKHKWIAVIHSPSPS